MSYISCLKANSHSRTDTERRMADLTADAPSERVQDALLLYEPKSPYTLVTNHAVPELRPNEVLVKNYAIGLNPIDWKAPYVYTNHDDLTYKIGLT